MSVVEDARIVSDTILSSAPWASCVGILRFALPFGSHRNICCVPAFALHRLSLLPVVLYYFRLCPSVFLSVVGRCPTMPPQFLLPCIICFLSLHCCSPTHFLERTTSRPPRPHHTFRRIELCSRSSRLHSALFPQFIMTASRRLLLHFPDRRKDRINGGGCISTVHDHRISNNWTFPINPMPWSVLPCTSRCPFRPSAASFVGFLRFTRATEYHQNCFGSRR